MWKLIKVGEKEPDISFLKNIKRGILFENEAIGYFEKASMSKTSKCGFFDDTSNPLFGSSPDALGPGGNQNKSGKF